MVAQAIEALAPKKEAQIIEGDFKWSSVSLSEVIKKDNRLKAAVFDIDGRNARELLKTCKWESKPLVGHGGLAIAYRPGICKRIFVEKNNGIPMLTPGQILHLKPKAEKYLSSATKTDLSAWYMVKGEIGLTCSGTVGNVTYVSDTLAGQLVSQNLIRIIPKKFGGYIYAYLVSKVGNTIVKTNKYGAVIQHIDPEHLETVPIPDPQSLLKQKIHTLIIESFKSRDKSNQLINEAESFLIKQLKLPLIEKLKPKFFQENSDFQNYQVKLSKLNNRLDGSYHIPIVDVIVNHISKTSEEVTDILDERISSNIILPGRFKRIYVEEGRGMTFFGGKQIYELDPSNKKYLSLVKHSERIDKELILHENMILITRSGTVGRVNIVPRHWENLIINEHVIRVVPANKSIAGYIYCWLNTDYGLKLIERFIYGAVVDEIDTKHVGSVQIPLLKNKEVQREINNLVLKANQLRYVAYKKEQKAIDMVNELILQ